MDNNIQRLLNENMISPEFMAQLNFVVVDDKPFNIKLMEAILFGLGATRIDSYTSPRHALDRVLKFKVDILIVDNMMPDLSGTEMIRIIRSQDGARFKRLPIIMATAYAERHYLAEAMDAGVTSVLGKPYSPQDLLTRITAGLKQSLAEALKKT